LPGAYRLNEARELLESTQGLSAVGVDRILGIYGGRAVDLLEFAASQPLLEKTIDAAQAVLGAEVVFAIREEMARTLIDIVHRRLMLGLAADQGRPLYEIVAAIAADEFGWDDKERHSQVKTLHAYSDSLLVNS
jgi:glycerol-3-phosphate dehydrogenase